MYCTTPGVREGLMVIEGENNERKIQAERY